MVGLGARGHFGDAQRVSKAHHALVQLLHVGLDACPHRTSHAASARDAVSRRQAPAIDRVLARGARLGARAGGARRAGTGGHMRTPHRRLETKLVRHPRDRVGIPRLCQHAEGGRLAEQHRVCRTARTRGVKTSTHRFHNPSSWAPSVMLRRPSFCLRASPAAAPGLRQPRACLPWTLDYLPSRACLPPCVCLLLQDLPPSNFPDGQQTVRVFHTIWV